MRQRTSTAVAGVLVEGAAEVTDEMIVGDTDDVFAPVTTELSSFDVGAEACLMAIVDDLMARGFLASMAADVATSVRERVYGRETT